MRSEYFFEPVSGKKGKNPPLAACLMASGAPILAPVFLRSDHLIEANGVVNKSKTSDNNDQQQRKQEQQQRKQEQQQRPTATTTHCITTCHVTVYVRSIGR